MFSKSNLSRVVRNYHYKDDYFICEEGSRLDMKLLPVLKPKNADEFAEISSYCQSQGINFKLVKGLTSNFCNPGRYDDLFAVDVDLIDSIIDFNEGSLIHLPGTTARQLNEFLGRRKDFSHQLSLSRELTDHFLIYNQKQLNNTELSASRRLVLDAHQRDSRWLILGLKSFESFYKIHAELSEIKTGLGGLINSFMIVNQEVILSNVNVLNNVRGINADSLYSSTHLKDYKFFLIIELFYNEYLYPGIVCMVKDLLGTRVFWGESRLQRIAHLYQKAASPIPQQSVACCETLSVVIDNDVNQLLYVFHAVYAISLASRFNLHLYIDTVSNNELKVYVKFYYLKAEDRKAIVGSILDLTNRIKKRIA
ncbi:hypothetical protein [Legionella sp. CNM-4043-24]|uniref:hypothetical protein n=1 Tax=Legionella sp. CNM-4043-24 TaxID=3421646 RepID=UPI00403B1EC3